MQTLCIAQLYVLHCKKMTRCVILYAVHSWKHAFMIAIESMAAGNKRRNDSENKVQTIVSVDLQ